MDQKPLVTEQIEDGNELICRFDKFAPLARGSVAETS